MNKMKMKKNQAQRTFCFYGMWTASVIRIIFVSVCECVCRFLWVCVLACNSTIRAFSVHKSLINIYFWKEQFQSPKLHFHDRISDYRMKIVLTGFLLFFNEPILSLCSGNASLKIVPLNFDFCALSQNIYVEQWYLWGENAWRPIRIIHFDSSDVLYLFDELTLNSMRW